MPLNLKGPGRIELNGSRINWSFHVSAEQRQTLHPVQPLGLGALRRPGSVLPEGEYVAFQATTFKGDIWTSTIARDPHLGGTAGGAGMASGHAFTLKNTNWRQVVANTCAFTCQGKLNFQRSIGRIP